MFIARNLVWWDSDRRRFHGVFNYTQRVFTHFIRSAPNPILSFSCLMWLTNHFVNHTQLRCCPVRELSPFILVRFMKWAHFSATCCCRPFTNWVTLSPFRELCDFPCDVLMYVIPIYGNRPRVLIRRQLSADTKIRLVKVHQSVVWLIDNNNTIIMVVRIIQCSIWRS